MFNYCFQDSFQRFPPPSPGNTSGNSKGKNRRENTENNQIMPITAAIFRYNNEAHMPNFFLPTGTLRHRMLIHEKSVFQKTVLRRLQWLLFPFSPRSASRHISSWVFGIFYRIIIPLSKSALITLAVVSILWAWNELLIALIFLQKPEQATLMLGLIQFQGRFRINQPVILAGIFVSMIPMIVVYLAGQRFFVKGLTAGALKGE